MAIPDALARRVGPWPLWGWGAIGAAGIGAGLLLRRTALFGGGGDEPEAELSPEDEAAAGYLAGPTLPGGGVALPVAPQAPPAPTDTTPATNLDWARVAITYLIARGVSPTLADQAVRKYLEGMALDAQERAAINLALGSPSIGVPPEGVPPIEGPPDPSPIPKPPGAPPTTGKPGAPAWVRASGHARGATITWAAVPGATRYRIRRETKGTATAWRTLGNVTRHEASALFPRPTTVAWRVQAGNAAGWGGNRNSNPTTVGKR